MKYKTITADVIQGKEFIRGSISALGRLLPQDILKRVYGNQVESEEQVTKRTGLNREARIALFNKEILQ